MIIHRFAGVVLHAGTSVCSGACFLLAGYKVPSWEAILPLFMGFVLGLGALSWKVGYNRGRFDTVRDAARATRG